MTLLRNSFFKSSSFFRKYSVFLPFRQVLSIFLIMPSSRSAHCWIFLALSSAMNLISLTKCAQHHWTFEPVRRTNIRFAEKKSANSIALKFLPRFSNNIFELRELQIRKNTTSSACWHHVQFLLPLSLWPVSSVPTTEALRIYSNASEYAGISANESFLLQHLTS